MASGRTPLFVDLIGGDEGVRTPDLCNAIAALCQTELRPQEGSEFGVSSSESRKRRSSNVSNIANSVKFWGLFAFENRLSLFEER